jgi:hypothetical protein
MKAGLKIEEYQETNRDLIFKATRTIFSDHTPGLAHNHLLST